MRKNSILDHIARAQIALDNAIGDSEISTVLGRYGYNTARLQQGVALLTSAKAQQHETKTERANLLAATDAINAAQRQAQDTYDEHIRIARIACKSDRAAREKLGLREKRSERMTSWLGRAQQFYAVALGDTSIADRFAVFGLIRDELTVGQTQIHAVAIAVSARQDQRGTSKRATRQGREKLAALNAWMSEFRAVARVAFKKRPDLLAKLGFSTRGTAGRAAAPGDGATQPAPAHGTVVLSVDALPAAESVTSSRRNGKAVLNGNHG